MDKIDKIIEKIIIFLNKTILRGYKNRQWDRHTKVEGRVMAYWDFIDEEMEFWKDATK